MPEAGLTLLTGATGYVGGRRLNAPHLLPSVRAGQIFPDGRAAGRRSMEGAA